MRRHATPVRAGGSLAVPWTQKVLPTIEKLVERHSQQTVICFVPASRPGEAPCMWAAYYRRWAQVTLANIDANLVELMQRWLALLRRRRFSTSTFIHLGRKDNSTRCCVDRA